MTDIADSQELRARRTDETHPTPIRSSSSRPGSRRRSKRSARAECDDAGDGGERPAPTRIVLVKGFDERGFVWYTNYDSRKGQELAGNPMRRCSSTGSSWNAWFASKAGRESSAERIGRLLRHRAARFAHRRLGLPQSQVIASRAMLVANAAKYSAKFMLKPPRPPHWGGYRLGPAGSSGKGASRACTTACAIASRAQWLRERLAP